MAEEFGFYDPVLLPDGTYDREYNAKNFSVPFNALINTGVMKGEKNELAVTSDGLGMITKIDTGIAFINGRYYKNTSFKTHQHDTETLGVSRIDRIVIRMNEETNYRSTLSYVKKGTPSANPVPPTLVQTESIYEISLAQVRIVGGQTFIATNAVTDERGKDVICPWAGSNILPSYDDNALAKHLDDFELHTPYIKAVSTDGKNYSATLDGIADYVEGMSVCVEVGKTNTTDEIFLSINNLPSKPIGRANYSRLEIGMFFSPGIYTLRYKSGLFIVQGDGISLDNTLTSTSTTKAATANAVKMVNDKLNPVSVSVPASAGWQAVSFNAKVILGICYVVGDLTLTTANSRTLGVLPVGFRPSLLKYTSIFGSRSGTNQFTTIDVSHTGAMSVTNIPELGNLSVGTRYIFSFSFPIS